MGADPLEGDTAVVEDLHDGGAGHSEEVGGLLGGQRHRLRGDGDGEPVGQGVDDLVQGPVDLLGDLDLFTRCGTGKEVARGDR